MDKSLLIFQLKTQWRIYSFNDKWTSDSDIHLLKIEWLNLKFYNYLISISCKRAVVGSNTTKSIFQNWRYSQVGRRRWTANPLFAGSNPAIVFYSVGMVESADTLDLKSSAHRSVKVQVFLSTFVILF